MGNTMLDGRNLIISVAVDRRKARELAEKEKTTKKKKQDKRNLYLAYEGVITEQDEAAEDMSPGDLAKRKRALLEKKMKLQNPNYFVSTTRLIVRNIPKEYTEKHLRALFRKHSPGSQFKQVKIVRESERGKSRGFGFVEFTEHNAALNALRAVNNNPKIWTKKSRPIVEFAVENAKALQKLRATMAKGKVNSKEDKSNNEDSSKQGSSYLKKRKDNRPNQKSNKPPKKKQKSR